MSNNYPDDLEFDRATVYAVLLPHALSPSFAIPLARVNERSNTEYTPKINVEGKVCGFLPVEPRGKIVPLITSTKIEIGHEEIYGVVGPDGKASVGTRKSLVPKIEKWIRYIEDDICNLNFALFCGKEKQAHALGKRVYARKLAELGDIEAATRWFTTSFVSLPLLREISKAPSQREITVNGDLKDLAPQLIFQNSSSASIVFYGMRIGDMLPNPSTFDVVVSKMLRFAKASTGLTFNIETRTSYIQKSIESRDVVSSRVKAEISRIAQFTRQERRLAEILLIYIMDIELTAEFLENYADLSGYTNRALLLLRETAKTSGSKEHIRIKQVADIIPKLIRAAFPHQRGRVILEISRVLGRYSEISDVVRLAMSRSNQREIVEVEMLADEFLRKKA
jgi:hypothetical protein